jgi:hypothetical protein
MVLDRGNLLILVFLLELKIIKSFTCFQKSSTEDPCEKWNKHTLTYHFQNPLPSRKLQDQRNEFDREIKQALSKWSTASGLTFIETTYKDGADIKIGFYNVSHGDCKKLGHTKNSGSCPYDFEGHKILAHSFSPEHSTRGTISELRGELHFNADEEWTHGMLTLFKYSRMNLNMPQIK